MSRIVPSKEQVCSNTSYRLLRRRDSSSEPVISQLKEMMKPGLMALKSILWRSNENANGRPELWTTQ